MTSESREPSPEDVHAYLHAIAELLRHRHRLDAASQAALADLVEEFSSAMKAGTIPQDTAARLAQAATHFAEAIHRKEETGVLEAARERLEEAALAAESHAPTVAGLARRMMDALSNIGI